MDILLWQERRLFEYWAHAASIVLMQDYPIHQMRIRRYGKESDSWSQQVSAWMQQNEPLRRSILSALQQRGPLRSRDFEDTALVAWQSSGWTGGRIVGRMLDFLWAQGYISERDLHPQRQTAVRVLRHAHPLWRSTHWPDRSHVCFSHIARTYSCSGANGSSYGANRRNGLKRCCTTWGDYVNNTCA